MRIPLAIGLVLALGLHDAAAQWDRGMSPDRAEFLQWQRDNAARRERGFQQEQDRMEARREAERDRALLRDLHERDRMRRDDDLGRRFPGR